MDELTIGDKIYVSSKKAAKITGYAKDYVGQLCREGRVEARLVGRNWYVLESSLMEHRFGGDTSEELVEKPEKPEEMEETEAIPVEESTETEEELVIEEEEEWVSPVYRREEPVLVPLVAKEPVLEQSKQVVSDMQTAWQEWFTSQKRTQGSTPEAESEQVLVSVPTEDPVEVPQAKEPDPIPESFQPEEIVPLTIRRESEVIQETAIAYHDITDLSQPQVVPEQSEKVSEARGGARMLQALMIVVAGIALCVALIGTGAVGKIVKVSGATSGPQKALLEYLGGESSYKSMNK